MQVLSGGFLLYVKLPRTSLTFAGFSYFTCVGKGDVHVIGQI